MDLVRIVQTLAIQGVKTGIPDLFMVVLKKTIKLQNPMVNHFLLLSIIN